MALLVDIAQGMAYIHSKRICHGDLNPANILLKVRRSHRLFFHRPRQASATTHNTAQHPPPDPFLKPVGCRLRVGRHCTLGMRCGATP
jgi:serine/threonine protein kinase